MEEKDDKLIERYYLNDLSEAELADFQRRLKEDEAFWEAVHLHADALEAIRLDAIALLRKRLATKGRELDAQNPGKSGRKWLWILPALLLCAFAVWRLARTSVDHPATPSPAAPNNAPAVTPPYPLPPPTPPARDTLEPAAPAKKTGRQIFAAWFKPYRDESLEPSVRGNDAPPSPSGRFQQLYWAGNYRAALAAFDSLGNTARNNDNLLFLQAICILDSGKSDEAAGILDIIIGNGRSRFKAQAPWYLALAQLRAGKRREATALLRRIAADTASPRQADARGVLREME
ncbi:MAG: hypothetical protein L6Q97_02125 [Thermoanaerobaculia bacterium]|nr:hypothetical protein [Thermoanaerobaculia bacterium]